MLPRFPLLLALFACGGEPQKKAPAGEEAEPAAPVPTEVCGQPAAAAAISWGDANADARVDMADVSRTVNALLHGGPTLACSAAQDLSYRDDLLDLGDALGLLYVLYAGNAELPSGSPGCSEVAAIEEAPCGRMLLSLQGPARAEGATGDTVQVQATVQLHSLDLEVEAWTLALSATGCTIEAASEAGTVAADRRLDPAGRRDDGWLRIDRAEGQVLQSALLSWATPTRLPAQEEPWPLLQLTLSAPVPASGCQPCTLALTDGLSGRGLPVSNMVSVEGRSFAPPTAGLEVEICAP
jgi:hypothetical protein